MKERKRGEEGGREGGREGRGEETGEGRDPPNLRQEPAIRDRS